MVKKTVKPRPRPTASPAEKARSEKVPAPPRKPRRALGPFSFLILDVLDSLPSAERYGARVEQEVRRRLPGQLLLVPQIYTALGRLKHEELVKPKPAPSPATRGYSVVLYELTALGRRRYADAAPFYDVIGAAARRAMQ